jgi:hypothetical protein
MPDNICGEAASFFFSEGLLQSFFSGDFDTISSTYVFHSPHEEHFPIHLGD